MCRRDYGSWPWKGHGDVTQNLTCAGAFLEPRLRGPMTCLTRPVKILLQPEDRGTHRCTLSSPYGALQVRKGEFLLCQCLHQAGTLLKRSHRHWCQHCHLERSREEERRFAVSCLLPVCTFHSVHLTPFQQNPHSRSARQGAQLPVTDNEAQGDQLAYEKARI